MNTPGTSKWPSFDPARDGNVFAWILLASAACRDDEQQRLRREGELARIDPQQHHARSEEDSHP